VGLDKAYAGEPAQQLAEEKGYEVHDELGFTTTDENMIQSRSHDWQKG
jgi:hypothetical protein